MIKHVRGWLALRADRRAVTVLEYGLIAALIAIAIATTVGATGTSVKATLTKISTTLDK